MGEGTRFWVGASTLGAIGSAARGIRTLDVAPDGAATLGEPVEVGPNPMYLAWRDGTLAIVHELADGLVSTWTVAGEDVRLLAAAAATGGADPCHVAFAPAGDLVLTANYSGSRVTAHRAAADADGTAALVSALDFAGEGPNRARQEASHPHQVVFDAARDRFLVPDLGADRIRVLRLVSGRLVHDEAADLHARPGSGPRHLVVADDLAIVADELDRTASVFDLTTGEERAVAALGEPVVSDLGASAIRLTRGGIVLIGDRALDAVQALRFDASAARLEHVATLPTGGRHPRDLQLTHDERHLLVADQQSDSIAIVALDDAGVPQRVVATVATPAPGCLARV
ncbi:lactonase family protein [Agromyces sp. MMS24-K17]|uniref:lactonase family protein n=1 Tax=Agromyces sp. MMS24-K17 TaxID=3372850 RepID=UPI0037548F16